MSSFQELIITWFDKNKRILPWRNTLDPYKIWVSEVILQQTRVKQGYDYYERFIETFPSIKELANAKEEEVLNIWKGLGYYTRARNLHKAAKQIELNFGGLFPDNPKDISLLSGVGPYTSAAISSIAFNYPIAAIDGNALRVYSRVFGMLLPVNSSKGIQIINEIANDVLLRQRPGDFNQAIMEIGALVCKPIPNCTSCPLRDHCYAKKNDMQLYLPVKTTKVKVKSRYFIYKINIKNESIAVQKRIDQDIWKHLYQFPLEEFDSESEWDFGINKHLENTIWRSNKMTHKLTHQKIYCISLYLKLNEHNEDFKWVELDNFNTLPMPKLVQNIYQDFCTDLLIKTA